MNKQAGRITLIELMIILCIAAIVVTMVLGELYEDDESVTPQYVEQPPKTDKESPRVYLQYNKGDYRVECRDIGEWIATFGLACSEGHWLVGHEHCTMGKPFFKGLKNACGPLFTKAVCANRTNPDWEMEYREAHIKYLKCQDQRDTCYKECK